MKLNSFASYALVGLVSLSGLSQSANAQAVFFTSTPNNYTNGAWSLGYDFTVNTALVVNSLGYYDDYQNGLTQSHAVGIFSSTGSLLASTSVSNSDSLNGYFRYHSITPLQLNAGSKYVIMAETGSENYTWNPTGFGTDSRITFGDEREIRSSSLTYQSYTNPNFIGVFGPNFTIASAQNRPSVPEPGMAALLMGAGSVGAGVFFRKRRK